MTSSGMSKSCRWDPVIGMERAPPAGRRAVMSSYFFLCRLAFTRLRYLCLLIFLRRFLMTEPMQIEPLVGVGVEPACADSARKDGRG